MDEESGTSPARGGGAPKVGGLYGAVSSSSKDASHMMSMIEKKDADIAWLQNRIQMKNQELRKLRQEGTSMKLKVEEDAVLRRPHYLSAKPMREKGASMIGDHESML